MVGFEVLVVSPSPFHDDFLDQREVVKFKPGDDPSYIEGTRLSEVVRFRGMKIKRVTITEYILRNAYSVFH
jgi:hypothetical protein